VGARKAKQEFLQMGAASEFFQRYGGAEARIRSKPLRRLCVTTTLYLPSQEYPGNKMALRIHPVNTAIESSTLRLAKSADDIVALIDFLRITLAQPASWE
jgi:hypothetical protein